jgi:RHS repeat-associated protein
MRAALHLEAARESERARYYASSMGRFMSPDWSVKEEPVPYSKLDNPQSLNLYGYVLNNPLSNVDADGHACCGLDTIDEVVKPLVNSAEGRVNGVRRRYLRSRVGPLGASRWSRNFPRCHDSSGYGFCWR